MLCMPMMMMLKLHRFRDSRRRCRVFLEGDNRTNGTNGMVAPMMRMLVGVVVMVVVIITGFFYTGKSMENLG